MERNLLVVGARPGSLGEAVAQQARNGTFPWAVTTAGISGDEEETLELEEPLVVEPFINNHAPFQAIVCTAGVNVPSTAYNCTDELDQSMYANVIGPMTLLGAWLRKAREGSTVDNYGMHFVAISSNSAHIARSNSLAYCATKAALSMALRCAAREMAQTGVSIYGYEPGWLSGTPMSMDVSRRLSEQYRNAPSAERPAALHRIPSGEPIAVDRMANMIVRNLDHHGDLNGCLIRVDGGEQ